MEQAVRTGDSGTGKHIPTYRVRVAHPRQPCTVAKTLNNRALVAFAPYHYGMLASLGHLAKSLGVVEGDFTSGTNANGKPVNEPGRTRMGERGHAVNLMLIMGLMGVAVLPLLDELAKKLTGD